MKLGNKRLFNDPLKLEELKGMLIRGYSYVSIARYFSTPGQTMSHASVVYRAKQLGLYVRHGAFSTRPAVVKSVSYIARPLENYDTYTGERINSGKSYAEYTEIEKNRKK